MAAAFSPAEFYTLFTLGTVFASASSGLSGPFGLAFDSAGNLYVANARNNTIEEFNSSGTGTVFASSGLDIPRGLAFDSAGNLYVSNFGNSTIEKFDSSGVGMVFANSGLDRPWGLAFDRAGNLYVGNFNGGTIDEFDSSGVETLFANGVFSPAALAFQLVPEPSAWALLAVDLIALLPLRRRHSHK